MLYPAYNKKPNIQKKNNNTRVDVNLINDESYQAIIRWLAKIECCSFIIHVQKLVATKDRIHPTNTVL